MNTAEQRVTQVILDDQYLILSLLELAVELKACTLPLVHLPSPRALKGPSGTRADSTQCHGLAFPSHPCGVSVFLHKGEDVWMLHLISSKFSRDVLSTHGLGFGRNSLTAHTNTSKCNTTCLPSGYICGGNRDHTKLHRGR